jgi:hypothetical protein
MRAMDCRGRSAASNRMGFLLMEAPEMLAQAERDPKNSLRFYITVPETEIADLSFRQLSLRIGSAEALLKQIKKRMAEAGAFHILDRSPKLKQWLPTGSHGDVKPCQVKRTAAGSVRQHHRVGMQITFSDPARAQAFAHALKIA